MAFGSYIRRKREAAGIPLRDFAQRIDISPAYWSRIEREMEKAPKNELMQKAARSSGSGSTRCSSRPAVCRRHAAGRARRGPSVSQT